MRRWLLILAVCLSSVGADAAQGFLRRGIPKYDFISDSLNKIVTPGSTARRDAFFEKLDSIVLCHEGMVNILHIGGSHVQADIYSHEIRRNLDSINDQSQPGRGLIFPYTVAKTNNPSNYKIMYRGEWTTTKNVMRERKAVLGLTGMAVTTSDSLAELTVCLNGKNRSNRWTCNKLTLLGYADSTCMVEPFVRLTDSSLYAARYDASLSVYVFEFERLVDTFTIVFDQMDSVPHEFTITGLLPEKSEPGVVYSSIGVNGATVPSYLSCENFDRDLSLIHPDMVVYAIGINDALVKNFSEEKFIHRYDSLISRVESVSPNCYHVFVTNNDSYKRVRANRRTHYEVNKNGLKARDAFYKLAEKHNGSVWDLFEIMGGLGSMKLWEKEGMAAKDKVHFTHKGYVLIGDLFYNALINAYLEKNNKE
ncbi:MAG: hypothetical protein J6Y22_08535 [Paludibacteraceae bacterium]|nr:hypothetical protein [Paludibacteraceae bacterium]